MNAKLIFTSKQVGVERKLKMPVKTLNKFMSLLPKTNKHDNATSSKIILLSAALQKTSLQLQRTMLTAANTMSAIPEPYFNFFTKDASFILSFSVVSIP